MTLKRNFEISNAALANALTECENEPMQWNVYSAMHSPEAPESAMATLFIRKTEQEKAALPLFDVVFMQEGAVENGMTKPECRAMKSKELNDLTGLDHASHFKKQTGDSVKDNTDAIFFNVSPREINALEKVNGRIAAHRSNLHEMKMSAGIAGVELGLDSPNSERNAERSLEA